MDTYDNFNPRNVALLILEHFHNAPTSQISHVDRRYAERIIQEMNKDIQMEVYEVEEEEGLVFAETEAPEEDEQLEDEQDIIEKNMESESGNSSNEEIGHELYKESPEKKKSRNKISEEDLKKAYDTYKTGPGGKHSFERMNHLLPGIIRNPNDYQSLKRYVRRRDRQPTRLDKSKEMNRRTLEKFMIHQGKTIHDKDLRLFAIRANSEMPHPLENFNASPSWCFYFKKKNHIVLRKVLKYISKVKAKNPHAIQQKANEFVSVVNDFIRRENVQPQEVLNFDQSGFTKILKSGYTLAMKGQRRIEIMVDSKSAVSHSYCIMPIIAANGHLAPILYMVIGAQPEGKWPKTKIPQMPANVYADPGKSYIMTKQHMTSFIKNVLAPCMPNRALCLNFQKYFK
uniref:Transposase n=1 Tax=Acrobeloides nanus TaxID=290746 RepID=A0A914D4Y2_9BILA